MDRRAATVEHDAVMLRATEWLLELQGRDVSVERISAWQKWVAEDPRHQQAFDRLQTVQECIDRVASPLWPTDNEVALDQYDGSVDVSTWQEAQSRDHAHTDRAPESLRSGVAARATTRRSPPRRRFVFTAAAGLAAAIVATVGYKGFDLPFPNFLRNNAVETEVGELRRVQLADGSTVTLGGHSRIAVDIDAHARSITLGRGEAFFQVAKDPRRPFVVHAGDAVIKAVGTAFDVRRAGEHVTVAVAEGVVEVVGSPLPTHSAGNASAANLDSGSGLGASSIARLTAGQRIRLEPREIPVPVPVVPDSIATWRDGHRQYLAEPLVDVIADLNRYSTRRIVISDPAITQLAVTGSVFERDIERWLKSLEAALPVQVHEEQDGTLRISVR